jgi:hypothetical protein
MLLWGLPGLLVLLVGVALGLSRPHSQVLATRLGLAGFGLFALGGALWLAVKAAGAGEPGLGFALLIVAGWPGPLMFWLATRVRPART